MERGQGRAREGGGPATSRETRGICIRSKTTSRETRHYFILPTTDVARNTRNVYNYYLKRRRAKRATLLYYLKRRRAKRAKKMYYLKDVARTTR